MSRTIGLKENCKQVLVLGNGFDLHHKMKTRYGDFIEFMDNELNSKKGMTCTGGVKDEIRKNNFIQYFISYKEYVGGWIDFEILIQNITKDIEHILEIFQKKKDDLADKNRNSLMNCDMNPNTKLIARSFKKIFDSNSNEGFYLKSEFVNNITGINKKAVINVLRKEFDVLCESLHLYLEKYEPMLRENPDEKVSVIYEQIKAIEAEAVITFNYTDTYVKYGLEPEDAVHVHGSLMEKNIVLGFDDDKKKELDFVYFKKYMQCILKQTPILEMVDFTREMVDDNDDLTGNRSKLQMHIFGHSLDKTDREKLLYIFEIASSIIVYYIDEDDREEKIEKVIRLLGKKKALKWIYTKKVDFKKISNLRI